jgi:hypothetical protein
MRAHINWFEEEPEILERENLKLTIELEQLDEMNEAEACTTYNVESKAEARQYIIDYYNM